MKKSSIFAPEFHDNDKHQIQRYCSGFSVYAPQGSSTGEQTGAEIRFIAVEPAIPAAAAKRLLMLVKVRVRWFFCFKFKKVRKKLEKNG